MYRRRRRRGAIRVVSFEKSSFFKLLKEESALKSHALHSPLGAGEAERENVVLAFDLGDAALEVLAFLLVLDLWQRVLAGRLQKRRRMKMHTL